ncbi:MAG: iron-containing alcohol dehydrogenase [Gammaproteobacteria bacterium]
MLVASPSLTLNQVRTLAFGPGCAIQCADYLAARAARSVFVVTSPPTLRLGEPLYEQLRKLGCTVTVWSGVSQEPGIADFQQTVAAARDVHADAIVGLGGGSAMDVAKLVAAFLDDRQPLAEAFGIGKLRQRATALVCLPTTSGTGSEVSPIAILLDEADELKKGVISEHLVPDAAFVDPLLTVSMPPAVTASTGMDALTHCIEAFANRLAHPLVDTWALEGIRLISEYLVRAVERPDDIEARTALSRASLYGGLCLGPVNTAAVHALAYPLGGEFHVAHGVSNAVLLPHVLEFNLPAAPTRYAEIAVALGVTRVADELETAQRGVQRIAELCRRCGIPAHLADFSIPESAIDRMARAAMTVTRLLDRNPRVVTEQDARDIYRKAF